MAADFGEKGAAPAVRHAPTAPDADEITPAGLVTLLQSRGTAVLDFTSSANYVKRHIPGAWFVIRGELEKALHKLPDAQHFVVTCGSGELARFAAPDVAALTGKPVQVLSGGTTAWIEAGLPLESGETRMASARIDRYRRPYEGTDNAREAMNAYLEWEYGLVAQLGRYTVGKLNQNDRERRADEEQRKESAHLGAGLRRLLAELRQDPRKRVRHDERAYERSDVGKR